ncbi:hypothetical protein NXC12_PE00157 (plasmid) [Rhizobium etli]|uniref:Uncharacterized protein n=1 Tax=Rhizobium etli TaxID=29449 RepID=A0AAN1BM66_RHIET|nr:hypothetical protein [Rhizobium etli]ARQ13758.1 hypothetical protein NXC12_PE00157 [Rhizobium etli]
MFSEIVASIFSMLLIEPLQAEVAARVAAAKAPTEIARASQECLTTQAPRLLERATTEVGWAASHALGITVGWKDPIDLLDKGAPGCAQLIGALKETPGDGDA